MTSQERPGHEMPEQHLTPREMLHFALSLAALILFVGIAILSFMAGLTWLGLITTVLLAAAVIDLALLSWRHFRRTHQRLRAG